MDKPIDIEALEKHVDERRAGLVINDYPKFQKATNALLEAVPALLAELKHLRAKVDHMAEEHACHDRFYERDSSCIAWKGTP